jgi:hypothetical protein
MLDWKLCGRSDHIVSLYYLVVYLKRSEENHKQISIKPASALAKIQTRDLTNTSQICYITKPMCPAVSHVIF